MRNRAHLDYPRVCGGTQAGHIAVADMSGLSPRVRGNPLELPALKPRARTIPACAGEPILFSLPMIVIKDYPRVCGGTRHRSCINSLLHGLSPRVRGNLLALRIEAVYCRTIPACAGEPISQRYDPGGKKDYPRVCGGT